MIIQYMLKELTHDYIFRKGIYLEFFEGIVTIINVRKYI